MYYAGLDVASKGSFVYVCDKKDSKVNSGEIVTAKLGVSTNGRMADPKYVIYRNTII